MSLAHHNFTEYRGDMYGPGWAEPAYWLFGIDRPIGFDIGFMVATGYDDPTILDRFCPMGGRSSSISSLMMGDNQLSFSIGEERPGAYYKTYIPTHNRKWGGYDILDGDWEKGWQVFGVTGGGIRFEEITTK